MNRICLFVIVGALSGCAHANDPMTMQLAADEVVVDNPGEVTVAGIPPAAALGAIDTRKVTASPAVPNGGESTSEQPKSDASGAIAVEGAQPAAVLGAIDTTKLIDKKTETPN